MNGHLLRRLAAMILVGGLGLALVSCGSEDGDEGPGEARWDAQSIQQSVADAPFVPFVTNSPNSMGVGTNRLSIALQRSDGTLVTGAGVTVRTYRLAQMPDEEPDVAELAGEVKLVSRTLDVDAEHQHAAPQGARLGDEAGSNRPIADTAPRGGQVVLPAHEDALTTVYTGLVEFDRAGWWGMVLDVMVDGQPYRGLQVKRYVLEDTPMPGVGDRAIATEHLTLAQAGGDLGLVSTAAEPIEDMLDQTVAEALETGRPVVIAFVTPAFCQTRFCGPVLESVVAPVWRDFGDRVEFVHVEPYEIEAARTRGVLQPVPSVLEWGLETEPFIYVVNADGTIAAAIEGITDEAELREAVEAVLG